MTTTHQVYVIRIQGVVNVDWSDWFVDFSMRHADSGETVIQGTLPDQTALHGVLMKIRDLRLTLVEVKRVN